MASNNTVKNPTLNIDKTTIGYSKEGIDKLIKEIETKIDNAVKQIDPSVGGTSSNYSTLVRELDNYWDGDDYKSFVATLNTASKELSTSLKQYKSKLTSALNNYKSQWTKFQSTNASQIKTTLKISK